MQDSNSNMPKEEEKEFDFVAAYGERRTVECGYCNRDVSRMVRMHCAECPNMDLCLECFSSAVDIHPHKNTHDYHITDNIRFPLFCENWTAQEELLLLDGVEMFGLGSWSDIASHVGSKNEKECQSHYLDDYLGRFGFCVPPLTFSNNEALPSMDLEPELSQVEITMPGKQPGDSAKHEVVKEGKTQAEIQGDLLKLPGAELIGFMPLREDFDVEHANEAEQSLADMEFKIEDDPEERRTKLDVIQIYNSKLQEREERKRFVRERGLLEYKKTVAAERRRPKEERALIAHMRPFARFHSHEEHTAFVEDILKANKLRKRIESLQQYRRLGIRTFAEVDAYEAARQKVAGNTKGGASSLSSSMPSYLAANKSANSSRGRTSRYLQRHGSKTAIGSSAISGSRLEGVSLGGERADLSLAPGAQLLSPNELELCSVLKLLPKFYLTIKDELLRACYKEGYLEKSKARRLIKIDMKKTDKVYDFFVQCGWVSEEPNLLHEKPKIY